MQLVAFWIELNIKHEAQRPIPVHKNSAPRSAAEQALKDIKADPELMERVGSATDDTHDSMIRLEHFPHFVCKKYVKNRQSSVALVHIWLVSVFSGDCVSNLPGLGVFERPSKGQQNREAWWQRAKIQSRGWCWRWRWVWPWQERMELGILVAACILICGVCSK